MPTIEERVAYLEGTVGEHTRGFVDLQHAMADIRTGLTELRTDINQRFAQVDQRFAVNDQRFISIESRLTSVDEKLDRHFTWLMGTQFAVLLAVVAALAGAYYL